LNAVCDEIPYQPNSFELFGFDVMIDTHLRPWLIEVNACPALARETDLDSVVKESLIEDTIKLVNPCKINRMALKNICKRRLYQTKKYSMKCVSERDQLEEDLRKIFCNSLPRQRCDFTDEELNYECLTSNTSIALLKSDKA
jgi:tubulin polyglutamylase TTLL5